jgi:ParB family chromosome partitioning protein
VRAEAPLAELARQIAEAHRECEAAQLRAVEKAAAAGALLLQAKKRVGHGRWLPWLEENCPQLSERQAQRYMALAKSDAASDLEGAWRVISGHAPPAADDLPHVARNTGEAEWFTPPVYLDAARAALGAFDLDPASCPQAQRLVRAAAYHTRAEDGLSKPWAGKIWLNPPYNAGLVDRFVGKLVGHYRAGDVTAAVVLVNNATDTAWFRQCAGAASAFCFPTGRVRFLTPDGEQGSPLQGQALLYLGGEPGRFAAAFGAFGPVLYPAAPPPGDARAGRGEAEPA